MAINYNEEELGLQLPNTNQGIMEVADLYNTPDGSIPYWGPEQYNYNEGMLNTPSNPETLNFTKAVNEYGYPLLASLSNTVPNNLSALEKMANYNWSSFDDNIAKNLSLANQMNTSLDNTLDNTLMSEALIDENRIPGRIQESVPNYQSGWDKFTGKIGDMWSGAKDKLSNFKMPPLGIMGLINAIGNKFEDRQLTGDVMDEYGNMYSAEDLNKMNAKGGWYTDPARSARRRTSRIANMRQRLDKDKKISHKNLHELVRQEKAQQLRDAKDAADRANIQNIQNYTGRELSGYRMSRPASERGFTGHGKSGMGRDPDDRMARGGRVGYANGGLASLFTRRG